VHRVSMNRPIEQGFGRELNFLVFAMAVAGVRLGLARAQDEATPELNVQWKEGPTTANLRRIAEIGVPAGYRCLNERDTQRYLEAMRNPTSGDELGLVEPTENGNWFLVFTFSDVGYVKDDEKDDLDAEAMLKSMRESNKLGNEERRKRGWPTLELEGWAHPPHYDPKTNNLEWALRYRSEGGPAVNYNTRILGRKGVMEVTLVVGLEELEGALPDFKKLLTGFSFTTGNRYAEFRSGDKIAQYGLAAMVTGGAAAVALKTGILQKFWKIIVIGVVAVAAGVKKFFGRLFGRQSD